MTAPSRNATKIGRKMTAFVKTGCCAMFATREERIGATDDAKVTPDGGEPVVVVVVERPSKLAVEFEAFCDRGEIGWVLVVMVDFATVVSEASPAGLLVNEP
ncbi:MAG: hypothetical protein OK452_04710 [Thaumarchaeota archaeon]|nr:hypothetical protein [Nitrososphaerota archaeon]